MQSEMTTALAEERIDKDSRYVSLSLQSNGAVRVYASDIGPIVESTWGKDEYEFWLDIKADAVGKLAFELLKDKLHGNIQAVNDLLRFCEQREIPHKFESWP